MDGTNQIMHKLLRGYKTYWGWYGKCSKKVRRQIKRKFQQIDREVIEEGKANAVEESFYDKKR